MKWLDQLFGRHDHEDETEQHKRHRQTMQRVDDVLNEQERRRERLQMEYDTARRKR